MSEQLTLVAVPDIGNFKDVDVIEIAVQIGDTVQVEETLITLESDKATMDVPSPVAGVVREILIKIGDKASQGTAILKVEETAPSHAPAPSITTSPSAPAPTASTNPNVSDNLIETETIVLGAGPGGYTAAFRAADLGQQVVLVERYSTLGGVCLNVGCIPSKALLHAAKVINETKEMKEYGIHFGKAKVDIDELRTWKESVISRLTGGLAGLASQRKVTVVQGVGKFTSAYTLDVTNSEGKTTTIRFKNAIIAAGSQAVKLPFLPEDPRIIDSTGALALENVPKRMLIIGGGIIGLEMATVYHALGSDIHIVEFMDSLIPSADKDLVRPLHKRIEKQYEKIYLKTKVVKVEANKKALVVHFEGTNAPEPQEYDKILVAVGRRPNGPKIDADKAGVFVNERGFIPVDAQQRTNVPHIFAIGDIVGDPMLAHKATYEAKIAAEVIAGHKSGFDALTIPSVAYTDPEVAWCGLTETEAKAKGIPFEKAAFPWAASGRSLSLGRDEGMTKMLMDPETKQVLGVGIVGPNAGDLIAEAVLAIEMGADIEDIALSIHPHPTLSETVAFAAEMLEGSITDLYAPKKKKK